MILLLTFAFIAGFITILSPCILSIAPILLASSADRGYSKPFGIIIGLIISFSFFTLSLTAIVQATGVSPDIFRYSAILIIIFFGLTMIFPALENMITIATARITQLGSFVQNQSTTIKTDFFSGIILGFALGLVWTPCAGPILATITALAATKGITFTAILITLAYSCGAAIPLFLLCIGGQKITDALDSIAPYSTKIRTIFGIIIIASACAMLFNVDTIIGQRFARYFPTFTIENNPTLIGQLDMLKTNKKSMIGDQSIHAPELIGIADWINSQPLTLKELRGTVVLIDFWTYSCINCVRTLPHVVQWYNTYKDKGFTVIGVHTPEFAFEKNKDHVQAAVKRFNITYPIALDNDYQTWQAYDNHYWPAHYLIDQNGMIVQHHFGEGNYDEMENGIRTLLNLQPRSAVSTPELPMPITAETYLGTDRGRNYNPDIMLQKDKPASYTYTHALADDQVGITGEWTAGSECIKSQSNDSVLNLNFIANKVYIVMQSATESLVTILLDGKPVPKKYYSQDMDKNGKIKVHEPRMYELLDLKNDYGRHTLTLQCQKGIDAYVFTFGGK